MDILKEEIKAIEECAEVVQAITKMARFGYFNRDPRDENAPLNAARVLLEIEDARKAFDDLQRKISERVCEYNAGLLALALGEDQHGG